MDSTAHICFNAEDRSYFSLLKKEIHKLAVDAGFTEKRTAEIDIIVAEITSNLLKHGGGGELLVRLVKDKTSTGLELISIDNGPGMADPAKMIEDGMSTANTLGQGLGSIKRLSDTFDLYSLKDWGTILLSRVYTKAPPFNVKKHAADVHYIVVAKPGEQLSGDGVYQRLATDGLTVFLGDGLGHGPEAHEAVKRATAMLADTTEKTPSDILKAMHTSVKKTRGLVGSIAMYDMKQKEWRICGIGNIATRMQNAHSKNYMSYNGVIGMNIPGTLNEQVIKPERGQLLIMCSDGIKTRWDMQRFTGILKHDLSILAAAIYKDFGRRTDDMSVLISRINTTV